MCAVLAAIVLAGGQTDSTSAATQLDPEEQEFMALLNDYRAQNDLGPILIDPSIQAAAEWMSTDLGANNYFSHTDSNGQSPWDRMCNFGYCHNTWKGENIAAGYVTAEAVFQGWKDSPGHNANMLGEHYVVMGIARVLTEGSSFGYYWTNDFGGHMVEASPPPVPTFTASPTATPSTTASLTATATPSPEPTNAPTAVPSATPTPTPTHAVADIDCDDQVTTSDVLTVLQFLGGLPADTPPGCPDVGEGYTQAESVGGAPSLHGDVDCNLRVDAIDAIDVLRLAGNMEPGANAC